MKKVILIVGPTASGKTGLSVELANRLNAEIINGDSVQIYKGLDIGSAKIRSDEMKGVKHHLLDIISLPDTYSVYQFQKDARKLIDQIDIPMIVGGTGLYIKAALYDYEFKASERNPELESKLEHESNEVIYEKLIKLDPEIKVDIQNRRRLIRAYEQALSGELRSQKRNKDQLLYDPLILYLDLDKAELERRLSIRLEKQIEEGFIEEVKKLKAENLSSNAIGYKEISMYLDGMMTLDEAKEAIIQSSKRLAKKQKTWFKNQMHPIMLDAQSETLYDDAYGYSIAFLKE